MINQTYSDIVTPELLAGAIENNEFEGFREDYHVLHCLIRKYQPKTFFEIGTNMGTGTNIICNAILPSDRKYDVGLKGIVYSLDLPTELAHISLQHPISEGKGDKVGINCKFAYTQLRGDSMEFDYSKYPCDAYFIDGEHDYQHPFVETREVVRNKPKLIIWHDADISEVWKAITDVFNDTGLWVKEGEYDLYRVTDTRIAYALRK